MRSIVAILAIATCCTAVALGQPANDDCTSAAVAVLGPNVGDNTGATDDGLTASCSFGGNPDSADIWWTFTAPNAGNYQFDTNATVLPVGDTNITLWDLCPVNGGVELACSEDEGTGLLSQIDGFAMTAGQTVFIRVAEFGSLPAFGEIILTISEEVACTFECPIGYVDESEPCLVSADDLINGGCNSTPPVFESIACGARICGSGWLDNGLALRDTDWYEIVLTEPTEVTLTVATGDRSFDFGIIDTGGVPDCALALGFLTVSSATGCGTPATVSACLEPGTWWLFVAPSADGVQTDCGTVESIYTLDVDCAPCVLPTGACCLADGSCLEGVTEAECAANGPDATWFNGVLCADANCQPVATGACCLPNGACLEGLTENECLIDNSGLTWTEAALCVDVEPCPLPPANDDCETATPAILGDVCDPTIVTSGSIAFATSDGNTPSCAFGGDNSDVWFEFAAPATGLYTIDTNQSVNEPAPAMTDTSVSVWDACPLAGGVEIACDEDGGDGFLSLITDLALNAGDRILIRVADFGATATEENFALRIYLQEDFTFDCPPGYVNEAEACGDDTNGGCNVAPCPADIAPLGAPDGVVDSADLNVLLSNFGTPCVNPPDCQGADLAPAGGDGNVDSSDLNVLLSAFGPCPPPMFEDIECGARICGTTFLDNASGIRDTDWYQLVLTETTEVTLTVAVENRSHDFGIIDTGGVPDCALAAGFLVADFATGCGTPNTLSVCLPAGTWWIFVAPTGDGVQLDCGAPGSKYTLDVDCAPCAIGACCLADGSCLENVTEADCTAQAGVLFVENTLCADANCPQPPPNDNCDTATVAALGVNLGSNVNALDDGAAQSCATSNNSDVWWTFTAPADDDYIFDTDLTDLEANPVTDTTMSIWDACPGNGGVELACDDDGGDVGLYSAITLSMTAGQQVWVRVSAFGSPEGAGDEGDLALQISVFVPPTGACCLPDTTCLEGLTEAECLVDNAGTVWSDGSVCADIEPCPAPVANDDCVTATVAVVNDPADPLDLNLGDNTGATNDGLAASCGFGAPPVDNSDIWWVFTATCDGTYTFSTCDTSAQPLPIVSDTNLTLWDDCPVNGGIEIACSEDFCGLLSEIGPVNLATGQTVYIRVADFGATVNQGTIALRITEVCP